MASRLLPLGMPLSAPALPCLPRPSFPPDAPLHSPRPTHTRGSVRARLPIPISRHFRAALCMVGDRSADPPLPSHCSGDSWSAVVDQVLCQCSPVLFGGAEGGSWRGDPPSWNIPASARSVAVEQAAAARLAPTSTGAARSVAVDQAAVSPVSVFLLFVYGPEAVLLALLDRS